jgi:hypothetical protein
MSHAHQITDAAQVRKFVLGGNARFTLVSKATGVRFTFKVRGKEDDDGATSIYFVSLLSGPDNESDYQYLGHIWASSRRYQHGKKSRIGADAASAKAFDFFWRHLAFFATAVLHPQIEFWHQGECARCGRVLTVPASIASGFGPECVKHI